MEFKIIKHEMFSHKFRKHDMLRYTALNFDIMIALCTFIIAALGYVVFTPYLFHFPAAVFMLTSWNSSTSLTSLRKKHSYLDQSEADTQTQRLMYKTDYIAR